VAAFAAAFWLWRTARSRAISKISGCSSCARRRWPSAGSILPAATSLAAQSPSSRASSAPSSAPAGVCFSVASKIEATSSKRCSDFASFRAAVVAEFHAALRDLAADFVVDRAAYRELLDHRARFRRAAQAVQRARPVERELFARRVAAREFLADAHRPSLLRSRFQHARDSVEPDLPGVVPREQLPERFLGLLRRPALELGREQHRARRDRSRTFRPQRVQLSVKFLFEAEPLGLGLREIEIAPEQARLLARDLPEPPQLEPRGGQAVLGEQQFDRLAEQRKAHSRVQRPRESR